MTERAQADPSLSDGITAFEREDYFAARKHLRAARERLPDSPRVRFYWAAVQYHLGHISESLPILQQLEKGAPPVPSWPAAVPEYICRCHLTSAPATAVDLGQAYLQRHPDSPRLLWVTSQAFLRLQRNDEALALLDRAWSAEAGVAAWSCRPGRIPGARASVLVEMERWEEGLDAVDVALAREPDNAVFHGLRSRVLLEGLKRPADAAEAARRATELDPETNTAGRSGRYFQQLALALKQLGQLPEARTAVDAAIAISAQRPYLALREQIEIAQTVRVAPAASQPAAASIAFADVGGMKDLKDEVRRIIQTIHTRHDEAKRYGIVRNGILLYGPPGCGKTFFARAIAGEFGLRFLPVRLDQAVSPQTGPADGIGRIFQQARDLVPCLLFFDEFDAIGLRRDGVPHPHYQQLVAALLQQLERCRDTAGLVIAAATNHLDALDPALIREGRFDYKVKVHKPDLEARREILTVQIASRPHEADLDLTRLAEDSEGFSAAQLRAVVDCASMLAMDTGVAIGAGHLDAACRQHSAAQRYGGQQLTWENLILPSETKEKLQFVEKVIENPRLADALGIDPPRGVLLYGPPGTGKTTVARVLASETEAAFFSISPADIYSKWLGDSERKVRELFEQARESVPAILFIDEVDAILTRRGENLSGGDQVRNAVVNVFLAEMDGIDAGARVFILGATNRPELIDEAVLRPGRLAERIEIGLPDTGSRRALLTVFTRRMRLAPTVDLDRIARETEGASGADLRGLCTAAGRDSFLREFAAADGNPEVEPDDFSRALAELRECRGPERRIGFAR